MSAGTHAMVHMLGGSRTTFSSQFSRSALLSQGLSYFCFCTNYSMLPGPKASQGLSCFHLSIGIARITDTGYCTGFVKMCVLWIDLVCQSSDLWSLYTLSSLPSPHSCGLGRSRGNDSLNVCLLSVVVTGVWQHIQVEQVEQLLVHSSFGWSWEYWAK